MLGRKRLLRRLVRERLAGLSADARRAADAALAARAQLHGRLAGLPAGAWVFGFASMPDEPDLSPLWEWLLSTGRRLAFPRWREDAATHSDAHAALAFHAVSAPPPGVAGGDGAGWVKAPHGIWEPGGDAPRVPPDRAGVVIVPGRAFAAGGGRLGRGKGCYDGWLRHLAPGVPTLALAYDEQIVDDVPVAPHDHPVDAWLTPTRAWG